MREMVYDVNGRREVLDTGYCFGILYYILNLGNHPTAYVKIPVGHWLNRFSDYNDIPIECHGGLTYMEDFLDIDGGKEIEGHFIGWDYGHCNDYCAYYDKIGINKIENAKKWTTEEIYQEVRDVCAQIKGLEKKEPIDLTFKDCEKFFNAGKEAKETEIKVLVEVMGMVPDKKMFDKKEIIEMLKGLLK